jgi:hypothetical protein
MEDQNKFSENSQFVFTNGKRWYYRLKGEKGLLDSLSDDDKMSHLIVSFINIEGKRFYTSFDNYIQFLNYMLKISEEKRNFHEVTIDRRPQKMRFDLDIKKFKYYEDKKIEEVNEQQVQMFFDGLIQATIEQFEDFGFPLDPMKNLLVFSSHGKEKWSYHIIIDGFYCDNHQEAGELYKRIVKRIPSDQQKYLDWLDSSIYSVNHCLRTLGSVKDGIVDGIVERRIKILEKSWRWKDQRIDFVYSEKPRTEAHRLSLEFERCFLSLTENCFPIPNLVQKYHSEDGLSEKKPEKADEVVLDFGFRLFQSIYGDIYSYFGTMGNIIMMTRNRPSGCPICERVHEKDNGFLMIKPIHSDNNVLDKYEIYFDCRRSNGKKIMIGEKMVLKEKKEVKSEKSLKIGFKIEDMEYVSENSAKIWK